jgi:hypothetical protein
MAQTPERVEDISSLVFFQLGPPPQRSLLPPAPQCAHGKPYRVLDILLDLLLRQHVRLGRPASHASFPRRRANASVHALAVLLKRGQGDALRCQRFWRWCYWDFDPQLLTPPIVPDPLLACTLLYRPCITKTVGPLPGKCTTHTFWSTVPSR